jgi:hypothetical protein
VTTSPRVWYEYSKQRPLDSSRLAQLDQIEEMLRYYRHLSNVRVFVEVQNGAVKDVIGVTPSTYRGLVEGQLSARFRA